MVELLETGRISSRGQIAIPVEIRREMGLADGNKVVFLLENDTLLIKKLSQLTWEEVTRPLRRMKKKIKENEVNAFIHKVRKEYR